jgi:TonB-dependent SusC/RagA subfamily outer membrane receptor
MKFYQTLFILLLFLINVNAQKKLTGKVLDYKDRPVVNAKIFLDSVYSNVETNSEGYFEVLLPEQLINISVNSAENGVLTSKYNEEDTMNFMFLKNNKFKKSKKKNQEHSVYLHKKPENDAKKLDVENDINAPIYRNIYELIRGRLPGVFVSNENKIVIRGVNSLNYNAEPLFVVDGLNVSSIDYIMPINVKKISVLKGADAAVYGLLGSNGVIKITTKEQ